MTTVFGKESDNFYMAFYEPDPKKRRKALDNWVKKTTPVVQKAVTEELKDIVEFVTQDRWTDEGWKRGEEKLRRIQSNYHIIMDIKIRSLAGRERQNFRGELPESALKKDEQPQNRVKNTAVDEDEQPRNTVRNTMTDEDDDYIEEGRSPNDDRSDSMNPNNDAYQASMDNRSDQMNPNNDAYWSSRGGGRR